LILLVAIICRKIGIQIWHLGKYIFDTLLTLVWGGNLYTCKWNDIKNIQNLILTSFLAVRRTTPYPIILLEMRIMPLEIL